MYLDVHDDARAWKGYPRDVLDTLHQNGLITDPKTKAQSVVLTDVGLERAASVFQTLLAREPSDRQRPPESTARVATPRLSQLQLALVERLFSPICAPHPDPAVSSQLRHAYRVDGYSVVLFESRPAFRAPHDWQDREVAKFRFTKTTGEWQLFCQFRDLKWHRYEPLPQSPDLMLVAEVRNDRTGIFWG